MLELLKAVEGFAVYYMAVTGVLLAISFGLQFITNLAIAAQKNPLHAIVAIPTAGILCKAASWMYRSDFEYLSRAVSEIKVGWSFLSIVPAPEISGWLLIIAFFGWMIALLIIFAPDSSDSSPDLTLSQELYPKGETK